MMDQKTGEPALDAKKKKIKADMEFVPDEPDGTVELTFRFSGNSLEGRTFVVFEELYSDGLYDGGGRRNTDPPGDGRRRDQCDRRGLLFQCPARKRIYGERNSYGP